MMTRDDTKFPPDGHKKADQGKIDPAQATKVVLVIASRELAYGQRYNLDGR